MKKKGFTLIELIIVIIIAGIIYATVSESAFKQKDLAFQKSVVEHIKNSTKSVCINFLGEGTILSGSEREFFNSYYSSTQPYNDFTHIDLDNHFDTNTITLAKENFKTEMNPGYEGEFSIITYFYRNGSCYRHFSLNRNIWNNKEMIKNLFKNVNISRPNAEAFNIEYEYIPNNIDNVGTIRNKNIMNKSLNVYLDRKRKGRLLREDFNGNDIYDEKLIRIQNNPGIEDPDRVYDNQFYDIDNNTVNRYVNEPVFGERYSKEMMKSLIQTGTGDNYDGYITTTGDNYNLPDTRKFIRYPSTKN